MIKDTKWIDCSYTTLTPVKRILALQSIKERTAQYEIFNKIFTPSGKMKILDVGVSSEMVLPDSNMFENLYPYLSMLTLATIEDSKKLRKIYPQCEVVKITPHKKLPFRNKQFDIAVSWATLEHVGGYHDQEFFLHELTRVSKRIYVTTPYRGCIYEPHTGFFFLHWLPLVVFRKICSITKRKFWANESNLNPLYISDLQKLLPKNKNMKIKLYYMFRFLPSHLIIYSG